VQRVAELPRCDFPVTAIAIDDSSLRQQQGAEFAGTIDAASIEGTRAHMLGESLLDAAHYARIELIAERS
jgi:hypothetical protein